MTDLDQETRARIIAEEAYRVQVRGERVPTAAWLGGAAGLLLTLSVFAPAFGYPGGETVSFFVGGNTGVYSLLALGLVVFLLALHPKTRVLNIFAGFLSLLYTLYMVLWGGLQAFLDMHPQYGWAGLILGGIIAMVGGALSSRPD